MVGWLGLMLGMSGRADEARGVLERLEAMARIRYVPPSMFAFTYLGREMWIDVRMARSRGGRARSDHDANQELRVLRPIRADPRFQPCCAR